MKMQMGRRNKKMSRFVRTSIGNVTWGSIKYVQKEERRQEGGYELRTEHKTRSTHNTCRETGREEIIHTRHRLIGTGKKARKVREGDRG